MSDTELRDRIVEVLRNANDSSLEKDASFRKGMKAILDTVVRGSNYLSSVPERIASTAKMQVLGGNMLRRTGGGIFTPKPSLMTALKKKLTGKSLPSKSIFGEGPVGEAFKSATKNSYVRGEKIDGALNLAQNMFQGDSWKKGVGKVFDPVKSVAGKPIKSKGMQRALGFVTNNPLDIALTALDYSQAKSKEEKNKVLTRGIPTFMLSNTISNLGGKKYSLMSNLMAGAIAHKAVNTALDLPDKLKKKNKKKKN